MYVFDVGLVFIGFYGVVKGFCFVIVCCVVCVCVDVFVIVCVFIECGIVVDDDVCVCDVGCECGGDEVRKYLCDDV